MLKPLAWKLRNKSSLQAVTTLLTKIAYHIIWCTYYSNVIELYFLMYKYLIIYLRDNVRNDDLYQNTRSYVGKVIKRNKSIYLLCINPDVIKL